MMKIKKKKPQDKSRIKLQKYTVKLRIMQLKTAKSTYMCTMVSLQKLSNILLFNLLIDT